MVEVQFALAPHRSGDAPSIGGAIKQLTRIFSVAGLKTPALDARLLALHACGISHESYILDPNRVLQARETETLERLQIRRLAHEPVSRIVGKREFWGHDFVLNSAVLDPRPDTETLVEAALNILGEESLLTTPLRIADLGTGSGNILLSLLKELPAAWGVGIDTSAQGLVIAQKNASQLGLSERAAFVAGDWAESLSGGFDMIVTNPPYIETSAISGLACEVRLYDPVGALDGGADGLEAYRKIAQSCAGKVRRGGWILLEAGAGQVDAIIEIFSDDPRWNETGDARIYKDLNGINRGVAIKRHDRLSYGKL